MSKITIDGAPLTPGVNLDRIDVAAGVAEAVVIGYSDGNMRMLAEYCLGRWAKGEEALAEKTAVDMGMDLTSWRRCLAAARAAGEDNYQPPVIDQSDAR